MAKLDQIDKKLKHSEEDRDVIRKELRNNKHEYLDSYFNLAKATEERLQQMPAKVDTTDKEGDKNIKKDMQEMKQRYDAVNSLLGSLETRMDTILLENVQSPVTGEARVRTPLGDRVECGVMARGVAGNPETHQELEGWT